MTYTDHGYFFSLQLYLLALAMQNSPAKNLRRAEDAHSFAFSFPCIFAVYGKSLTMTHSNIAWYKVLEFLFCTYCVTMLIGKFIHK